MEKIDLEEVVFDMCCWCGRRLQRDEPVVDFGAKLAAHDHNLETLLGCSVEIENDGTVVMAIVCESGSEAKEAGDDLLFMACSDECAESTCDFMGGIRRIRLTRLSEATVRLKMKA